jgi:hypothetical protein
MYGSAEDAHDWHARESLNFRYVRKIVSAGF